MPVHTLIRRGRKLGRRLLISGGTLANWTVPGYTQTRSIGAGGTGRVVEALHDGSGDRVCIKYLSARLCLDGSFRERLRTEAVALAGLEHPNVVRVRGLVETDFDAAVVMELVEGVSLRQVLAAGAPLSPQAALSILRQSLLGLGVIHYLGIVHRDYKPANVLLTTEGASKLVDAGIADRSGAMVPAAGTSSYMAPELWEGATAGPATDVYAATATLYEGLTGRVPYIGDSVFELQTMHRAAPIPISDVPPAMRQLLAQGLAKTPEARPTVVAFLAELEETATAAYGPGWEELGRQELTALVAPLNTGGGAPDPEPWAIGAQNETVALPVPDSVTFSTRTSRSAIAPRSPHAAVADPAENSGEDSFDDATSWSASETDRMGPRRGTKAVIAVAAIAVIGTAMAAMALGSGKSTPTASGPPGQMASATSGSGSSQDVTTAGPAPGAPAAPGARTTGRSGSTAPHLPDYARPSTVPTSSVAPVVTGTQIAMSLQSQSSAATTTTSWSSPQKSSTAPATPSTSTVRTSSTPSQTPSSTVSISATAQAVNGTYTGVCPPTQGPTITVAFTVAGLSAGDTVAITYHWHLTDGATGDGTDQSATVTNGTTSFQVTVNPPQQDQSGSDSVTVDWTAADGLSGTTNKVPITITCQ